MNHRFKVEFIIFNKNKKVSKKQKELKQLMMYGELLNDILKDEFKDDLNYKYLDRAEASISSIDETKQLRLIFDNLLEEYSHSLHFHQNHSSASQCFTFEELKYISMKIKNRLEIYLKYEIDEPIIYISVDEL